MIKLISIGLLLFSVVLNAQNNQSIDSFNKTQQSEIQRKSIGELAFDGKMTPSEIIAELYSDRIYDEDGTLNVEITVPIIKNQQIMVKDTSGFPSPHNEFGEIADTSIIKIPFSINSNDVSQNKSHEFNSFLDNIDTIIEGLKIKQGSETNNKDVLNLSNCGGFPLGTTITDTWSRGWPFCKSISTTYSCLRVNNANNWYITNQVESILPCEFEP